MEHFLRKIIHRLYLAIMTVVVKLAPTPKHMVMVGERSSEQLCAHISHLGLRKIFLVTDKPLVELGLASRIVSTLEKLGLDSIVYDGVLPDPTYGIVDEGLSKLKQHSCDGVLALGGGSVIDAAKVIAMAATNPGPKKSYVGYFKVKQPILPFFAIPTTSGTGSEATMGAVISDTDSHEKSIIADPKLCPLVAALDPLLLTGLPPAITAATGMDALTHAIEVYIGLWGGDQVNSTAKSAVKMIFDNLPVAFTEGSDLQAREQMAIAAYNAGIVIGEVHVGNVHAIAHQVGAKYRVPHGLANAIVLPHVLRFSKCAAQRALAELAIATNLGSETDSDPILADRFITAVTELNKTLGVPMHFDALRREDIDELVDAAVKEGAGYPVPILMSRSDCRQILMSLLSDNP